MEEEKRGFFDVFTGLKAPDELRQLFQEVQVLKVSMSRSKNIMYVTILSPRLIHKKYIFAMEREIKRYLGRGSEIGIKIREKYNLSKQYTPSKLAEIYMDSLLFEIKEKSIVDYNILRRAKLNVEEEYLTVQVEDSFLARSKAEELCNWLRELMESRFGYEFVVRFEYVSGEQERIKKEAKQKLQLEVNQVLDTVVVETEAKQEEKAEKEKQDTKVAADTTSYGQGATKARPERKMNFKKRAPEDKDVFYGRSVDGDIIDIKEIVDEIGEVVIHGKLLKLEMKELKIGKTIFSLNITDFTDTIVVKIFVKNIEVVDMKEKIKQGSFYRIKGMAVYDKFDKEITINSVMGIKEIPDFTTKRMDTSVEKRVELHLHTMMSDMDSVVDINAMIKRAKAWGHKAIAITDHGVAQAFPVAFRALEKNDPFKIIYGLEGYFVDDLKEVVKNSQNQNLKETYVVFDLETTGFSPSQNRIIEIGAVKVKNGEIVDRFSQFVNPKEPIPFKIENLTGINDNMVINEPEISEVLPKFLDFCEGAIMVAHNAEFDMSFIEKNAQLLNLPCEFTVVDTVAISRILLPELGKHKLNNIAKHLGISLENHHRAVDDAEATAEIFLRFIEMLEEKEICTLDQLNELGKSSPDAIKKATAYHGIILVKNEVGRVNLYRLISASHLDYFNRRPRIPKSLINKYREGLILGSACEAGELYQAILREQGEEEIARLVNFYDYLEIQPLGNNKFMIASDKVPIENMEQLMEINRKICRLGEQFQKPVVATCDVHFLDPEDEVYRRILMAGKGFKDADDQAPLYLRTTEEMLEEFQYLGSDKAREVVITNTNLIADMIDVVAPVRPDKCPPVIEKSDETLTKICYDKAHEIYGPDLPEVVVERLERELNSIISNGFAVMYIIAQKLVWDSNDHGYLVGSRGSVGSSFVATMSGITEVNPLSAHYICPNCHFVDFDSELVKKYVGKSGCDMPDRDCPNCGTPLKKEGHDIPFETFLGFKGDKEPDIDLNFSGDYQASAHAYTEELFGKGKAFRAGTIGGVAEKTAYGYVYKYFEERGTHKRRCEMERIAEGCTGVKRTTGQHPGGIIVLPRNEEIYSFTPIQHPANDMNTPIITTHFEYHSIDHNLLKLDILGHDDPTIIRMLEDLTGVDAKTIPLDDQKVMSLFHNTEALGIKPEDIGGIPLGSLGIPEFGTDFVIQMLIDTNPKSFSDLVRISGLSHGTDVWLGNAQTLIEEGKAEISTAICTRDDIMTYLINMGLDSEESFKIMEAVRKGLVAKGKCANWSEWEQDMLDHGVPDWYIWSCKKIKYMFPKAHAAAYVMMAWRIAYFKVYYPVAYYTAFFSIRASDFSYETMCFGKEKLEYHLKELMKLGKENQTAKAQGTIRDMRVVQEMYARGIEFTPIDLYTANAKRFQIVDGKIMPALGAIDGLGEKAAEAVVEAAKKGPFLSQEDFKNRTKVSKTVVDKMVEMGLLGDLPESNQLSFF